MVTTIHYRTLHTETRVQMHDFVYKATSSLGSVKEFLEHVNQFPALSEASESKSSPNSSAADRNF